MKESKENLTEINSIPEQNVIDIAIPEIQKKCFRINGNPTVVFLNTSDMGIISRLENTYDKLENLAQEASSKLSESLGDETDNDEFDEVVRASAALQEIDKKMRELVDYIFDASVSKAAAPSGTMFDLFNGEFRFELVIKRISALYEDNLSEEFNKVNARMKKHTKKYTGK